MVMFYSGFFSCRYTILLIAIVILVLMFLPRLSSSEENYDERQPNKVYEFPAIVYDLQMTSDGDYFALSNQFNISWYRIGEDEPEWISNGDGGAIQLSGDNNYLLSVDQNTISLYNTENDISGVNYPISQFITQGRITAMDISYNGRIFCVVDEFHKIYLFDRTELIVDIILPKWIFNSTYEIYSIALSGNGDYLAAGTDYEGNRLYFFSTESNTPLWIHYRKEGWRGGFYSTDISHDGDSIIIYNIDGAALLHHTSNKTVWEYSTKCSIEVVRTTPNGEYFVVGAAPERGVHFLDENGNIIEEYESDHFIDDIRITPDGQYLMFHSADFIGDDNEWRLFVYFITPNGNSRFTLNGTQSHEGEIAMSDDGRFCMFAYRNHASLFINSNSDNNESEEEFFPDFNYIPFIMIVSIIVVVTIVYYKKHTINKAVEK